MNKLKFLGILIALSFSSFVFSQSDDNSIDTIAKPDYLVGKFARADLQVGDYGKHFFTNYRNYQPCQEVLPKLNVMHLEKIAILPYTP